MQPGEWAIVPVALIAATVNGGLGYGFSSITVPAALLVYAGRVLNPALVLLEVFINGVALVVNRRGLAAVWPRVFPLLVGAAPAVVLGGALLSHADPGVLKLWTFSTLLPLILLQSAGALRPLPLPHAAAIPTGAALGVLYGATTISGPPLALLFNNQGLSRDEFRAALSIFRIAESCFTLAAYLALGLVSRPSLALAGALAPAVLIGVPAGWLLLRRVAPEPFRRVCMAVDSLLVGFGLARTLIDRHLVTPAAAWAGLAAVACVQAAILIAFVAALAEKEPVALAGGTR